MKARIVKGIALFVSVVMVLGLTACGSSGQKEERPEFVYVPEYIQVPQWEGQDISVMQMSGEKLYYRVWSWDETTGQGKTAYYALDLSQEGAEPVELALGVTGGGQDFMHMQFDENGNMYAAVRTYEETQETDENGNTYTTYDYENAETALIKYLADGGEEFRLDLTKMMNEVQDEYSRYIQYMEIDKAGNIYLSNSESKIWVVSAEGQHLFTLDVPNWINGLGCSRDGDVYVTMHDMGGMVLKKIDLAAKDFGETLSGLPTNFYGDVQPGITGDFLLKGDTVLYEYDAGTQTYEEILKFIECDINGSYVQDMCVTQEGRILVYYSDWSLGETEIVSLVKTPSSEVTEKVTLTLGGMYISQDIQSSIIKFNKSSDQYRITIKDYSETMGTEENAWEDALTRMNNDILTGNAPDMISLDNMNVKMLAAKGVLEDLTPYLESSGRLSREDMIDSVLKAYTMSDTLCGIPLTFYISTLISGVSVVGEETGWTVDEMIATADQMPADAPIMEYATKNSMLQTLIVYGVDSYMNWETGECSFESDEFIKVLEFANRFPKERTYSEDDPVMPELVEQGKLLAVNQTISSAGDYQIIKTIWGEDVTCIGYPTNSGNGSVLQGSEAIAVSAKSKNKDVAWEFLEGMIADAAQESGYSWGFPITRTAMEAKFEEDMTPNYQYDYATGEILLDENGEPLEYSKGGWSFGNNVSYDIYAATQEEVDAVKELIESTTTLATIDMEILNIIQEEAAFYFEGQKSAAEVAEVIQSTIQVYVDENR